jgi:ubiquinone biosynthesis protein COQ4
MTSRALHDRLEIPPPPPRQSVHVRRAWREFRALIADADDTERAISLMYAIGRREFERNFQRFAASSAGRALIAERPSLFAALSDRDALARMPAGSLGRAYLEYLDRNGFEPEGLLDVQSRVQARWEREEDMPPIDPVRTWYRDRTLLQHDLCHLLTEYGTDEVGEGTLLAFSLAQQPGRGLAFLTIGAALELWRTLGWRWLAYDFRAWRRGRRANALAALPWEELLPLPLTVVRRIAGVAETHEVHEQGILRGTREDMREDLRSN